MTEAVHVSALNHLPVFERVAISTGGMPLLSKVTAGTQQCLLCAVAHMLDCMPNLHRGMSVITHKFEVDFDIGTSARLNKVAIHPFCLCCVIVTTIPLQYVIAVHKDTQDPKDIYPC